MSAARVAGLRPAVPPHHPASPARWWHCEGNWDGTRLAVETRLLGKPPPSLDALTGLAAPCSLPRAFLEDLGIDVARPAALHALARFTRRRLFSLARSFAAKRSRGSRHPARSPAESHASLDRRRLALFHAALPVLRATPTMPWSFAGGGCLFEVDPPAVLATLGLPAHALTGEGPEAVARRALILGALREGVFDFPVEPARPELALASRDALDSILAAAMAQWLSLHPHAQASDPDAEAWIPLPVRG